MRQILAFSALLLASGTSALAQHEDHGDGHTGKLGKVTFPVSCTAPAQQQFPRAVALLHSFWWEEAGVAFRQVAQADPNCAMAYWGQAMVARGNPFAGAPSPAALANGWQALEKGLARTGGTPRERAYVSALATFFRDHASKPHAARAQEYEQAMQQLARQFPADTEAVLFHALAVAANASTTDTSFSKQRQIGQILEPLVAKMPEHPGLTHYIIHTYDSPKLASMGVDAARRYGEVAPAAYHAHHMPSHIFVRLGMWDETVAANERSAQASRDMVKQEGWKGVHNHQLHAYDYMVYGFLNRGKDREAKKIVDEVAGIDSVVPGGQPTSDYPKAAIPARFALERNAWAEAAKLTVRPTRNFPAGTAITHYARGIGAVRSGDAGAAATEIAALEGIEQSLAQSQPYWATLVKSQRLQVQAWVALAAGDTAGALRLATQAADIEDGTDKHPVTPGHVLPAREVLADMLLQIGRHGEARRQYDAVLAKEPHRARSIYGAGRAAEMGGETAVARSRIQEYIRLMSTGNRGQ